MSDNRPPYHRRATKPFPRVQLAPTPMLPTDVDREADTLVECPCRDGTCPCCKGTKLVTAENYPKWKAAISEFEASMQPPTPAAPDDEPAPGAT